MLTSTIGRPEIAALIPHTGTMCLLDRVVRWDSASIVCTGSSQCAPDHPLASDGRLDPVCGIEYAAQAMAIHGGLTGGRRPDSGYLASVRDVLCHAERLDLVGELEVSATLLLAEPAGAVYRFTLRHGNATILEGRAAVVIDAGRSHETAA
jgi:predicted hotdog family 3-hydroxylacyl-ACP dehydratase